MALAWIGQPPSNISPPSVGPTFPSFLLSIHSLQPICPAFGAATAAIPARFIFPPTVRRNSSPPFLSKKLATSSIRNSAPKKPLAKREPYLPRLCLVCRSVNFNARPSLLITVCWKFPATARHSLSKAQKSQAEKKADQAKSQVAAAEARNLKMFSHIAEDLLPAEVVAEERLRHLPVMSRHLRAVQTSAVVLSFCLRASRGAFASSRRVLVIPS